MNINGFAPGPDLYNRVRGGFVAQGTTLSEWCRNRKTSPTNARSALVGAWNGPKGTALREELIEASRITHPSQFVASVKSA